MATSVQPGSELTIADMKGKVDPDWCPGCGDFGVLAALEKALVELLISLKAEGKTMLIVHHDLTTVKSYFDWLILLNSCLIGCGPVAQVFNESNLKKAYGNSAYLLTAAKQLTESKETGG